MFDKFKDTLLSSLMIVTLTMVMIMASCGESGRDSGQSGSDFSRLRDEGLKALNRVNYDLATVYGDSLLELGNKSSGHPDATIYGYIIKGQAAIFTDSISMAYPYLHDAEALCMRHNNNFALASVYNGLGLYSCNIEKDNNEALRYFFLGLDAAKEIGQRTSALHPSL